MGVQEGPKTSTPKKGRTASLENNNFVENVVLDLLDARPTCKILRAPTENVVTRWITFYANTTAEDIEANLRRVNTPTDGIG